MTISPLPCTDEHKRVSHETPDWAAVPVFIVNRNRLGALQRLVDWLLAAGTRRIVILDNASDYPPLLRYYDNLPEGAKALLLPDNHGPYVLWEQGVHRNLDTPYVVTDSDVVPTDECPADLIGALLEQLQRHPSAKKVGCGLRIDNLPDCYGEAETVRRWESQFWERPIAPGVFAAPVDTTFAIYPARGEFSNEPCNLRLGRPYVVEHTPVVCRRAGTGCRRDLLPQPHEPRLLELERGGQGLVGAPKRAGGAMERTAAGAAHRWRARLHPRLDQCRAW